jgi:tetratricopeptide (TPR) repeat protein
MRRWWTISASLRPRSRQANKLEAPARPELFFVAAIARTIYGQATALEFYLASPATPYPDKPSAETPGVTIWNDIKEKDKNMNRLTRLPVLAALLAAMLVSMTGCDRLKARDQLNKGVAAYKAGKFEESITHFQNASKLDPKLPTAKEYLATALSMNVVPGITTKENLKTAQEAIDTFQGVLHDHPDDVLSKKGVASIYFNIKELDKAKDWQKQVLALDPKDPEAAYTVGVIDWTQAHEHLLKLVGNDDGVGNAKTLVKANCTAIQQQNGPLVEEGLKYLNMAIQNRPNYDEAMAYLNLTYRKKADIDCGNEDARKDDVAKATDWNSKAMKPRKKRRPAAAFRWIQTGR